MRLEETFEEMKKEVNDVIEAADVLHTRISQLQNALKMMRGDPSLVLLQKFIQNIDQTDTPSRG